METTLYNHKVLGGEEKPLIPNIIFKALLTLQSFNDLDACEYILKCYSLAPAQLSIYNHQKLELNKFV